MTKQRAPVPLPGATVQHRRQTGHRVEMYCVPLQLYARGAVVICRLSSVHHLGVADRQAATEPSSPRAVHAGPAVRVLKIITATVSLIQQPSFSAITSTSL